MLEVHTVARGVDRIRPTGPGPRRANSYGLDMGGGRVLLVEPTCHDDGPDWLELAAHWNRQGRRIEAIVLTHWHIDHALGLSAMAAQLQGAPIPVWAPQAPEHAALWAGNYVPMSDGDTFDGWRAMHTPGHSAEHLCYWNERRRWLIAGDVLSAHGVIVFDRSAYVSSYERLRSLGYCLAMPGHGPILDTIRPPKFVRVLDDTP